MSNHHPKHYLGINTTELNVKGAFNTAKEISGLRKVFPPAINSVVNLVKEKLEIVKTKNLISE